MKKILIAMVLFALMALPMSAMAMTSIDDSDLSTVTGQSGVSIGLDMTMDLSFGTVAWGDLDGLATVASGTNHDANLDTGGWVGIQNLAINDLRIHMRADFGMVDAAVAFAEASAFGITGAGTDAAALAGQYAAHEIQASKAMLLSVLATNQLLTIDIYTDTAAAPDKTYVRIGLPTVQVLMGDLDMEVGAFTNNHVAATAFSAETNTPGTFQSFGKLYIGDLNILVEKNNYVDISQNDTDQGILIHIGNKGTSTGYDNTALNLATVGFSALSWGDCDGLNAFPTSGTEASGFIGITGMNLTVGMDMYMNINVGTATGYGIPGVIAQLAAITDQTSLDALHNMILAAFAVNHPRAKDGIFDYMHSMGTISATSVDIALSGQIRVSIMQTQVRLADNQGLTGTYMGAAGSKAGILGNLYIGGLQVDIAGNAATGAGTTAPQSWVSISAH